MRTGMEAVYTLLNIDRGVPEVWGSTYDVRSLIDAAVKLRDGKMCIRDSGMVGANLSLLCRVSPSVKA